MRAFATAVGVLATLVALASPATAGGWWTYPQLADQAPGLPIGESASVTARVMFSSSGAAADARATGGYHAYLVRGIARTLLEEAMTRADPGSWWTTPEETIHLGELTFSSNDANLVSVSATFVVPDVDAGAYHLMLCNLGCSEPLADVVPLESIYVGDPAIIRAIRQNGLATEQAIGRLERVEARLDSLRTSAGEGLEELETQVDELTLRVDRIRAALAAVEMQTDAEPPETSGWPWWVGWIVAVGIGLWSWLARGLTRRAHFEVLPPASVDQIVVDERRFDRELVLHADAIDPGALSGAVGPVKGRTNLK